MSSSTWFDIRRIPPPGISYYTENKGIELLDRRTDQRISFYSHIPQLGTVKGQRHWTHWRHIESPPLPEKSPTQDQLDRLAYLAWFDTHKEKLAELSSFDFAAAAYVAGINAGHSMNRGASRSHEETP